LGHFNIYLNPRFLCAQLQPQWSLQILWYYTWYSEYYVCTMSMCLTNSSSSFAWNSKQMM